jgi:isopentenyl phosphate kinase
VEPNREIKILKLGGSLLTDKNKPFSIRENVVDDAIQQIIQSGEKLILIHGGGSFGHPLAKEFNIFNGINPQIKNQILGLVKTHEAMIQLNSIVIKKLLKNNVPAISIQPSSFFIKKTDNFEIFSTEIIENLLDLDILPVLYGDIVIDANNSFSIISGENIIIELCKNLRKYRIIEVIFAIEKDGLFIEEIEGEQSKIVLCSEVYEDEIDRLKIPNLENKIDVTGGIEGKIKSIKEISAYKIPVQIINGLKENYIYKAIKNKEILSTRIIIRE